MRQTSIQNPTAVANRVKSARMLSGCTRKSFSEVAGLSIATLRSWEEPGFGRRGITAKGASRLVNALNSLNVFCSADWILRGEGTGPRLLSATSLIPSSPPTQWSEEESILRDLQSFKENNSEPVLLLVADSAMAPRFVKGEYVGGSKRVGVEIHAMIGCDCIIETESGLLLRRLGQRITDNTYVLIAINPDAEQVSVQASVVSAAEVVWRRCRRRIKSMGS
jgi:transcriptional regulator with XRE-family HTH domain